MELLASTKTSDLLSARAAAIASHLDPDTAEALTNSLSGLLSLISAVDRYKKPRWEHRSPVPRIKQTLIARAEDILRPFEL